MLKCIFCGEEAVEIRDDGLIARSVWRAMCDHCGAKGQTHLNKDAAEAEWVKMVELQELNQQLIASLESMASQYLTRSDGRMTHDFMSAGEECLPLLEDLGIVTTADDVYYEWVEQ